MTTSSPTHITPAGQDAPASRQPLRLSLGAPSGTNPVNGAWWPQSRDLRAEGADLVDHFPREAGRVDRLLYSAPDWDLPEGTRRPRHIEVGRGTVKVGSFPRDDTHVMIAKLSSGRHLRLLVVPHDLDDASADRLMTQAAAPGNTSSPHTLLGLLETS